MLQQLVYFPAQWWYISNNLQLTILIILTTYQMLWGAGTGVYGTAGIYCNPSTNTFYTNGDIVAFAASDRRLKIT
jgi:hypothetical protein